MKAFDLNIPWIPYSFLIYQSKVVFGEGKKVGLKKKVLMVLEVRIYFLWIDKIS